MSDDLLRREDALKAFEAIAPGIHWVQLSKKEIVAILRALPAVQPHVNETAKREHDGANVLTSVVQPLEPSISKQ